MWWIRVYKEGFIVDEGYFTAMKGATKIDNNQYVFLSDECTSSEIVNERKIYHSDEEDISFKVFTSDDKEIYDSCKGLLNKDLFEAFRELQETKLCRCRECGHEKPEDEFMWTYDRYGIPYKKVCENCYPKVDKEIKKWVYNPSYCGEGLEEAY